jgi:hypothetical protein
MTCVSTFALAVVLAASDPDPPPRTWDPEVGHRHPGLPAPTTTHIVHRHAAILTSIGATLAVGGAIVLGVGLHDNNEGRQVGGASLAAFGVSLLVMGIILWLWPGPVPPGWHASS